MDCQKCREALSARLDGEVGEGEDRDAIQVAATRHVESCEGCQVWFDQAVNVTRLVRIGLTLPSPGVPDSVLDAAPGPRRARVALALRAALGLIGATQLLVAISQIATSAMATMSTAGSIDGATPDHLLHESAAWNIGVGAAFLLIAGRFARPASVVGILTAFVAALTLLSADDVVSGAVTWSRLASHLLLVAGYLIVVVLSRPSISMHEPPSGKGRARKWRLTPSALDPTRMAMVSPDRVVVARDRGETTVVHERKAA
jgi:predicted anti-sigma-YlaC factor YlaD